jgi:hypothetical protein
VVASRAHKDVNLYFDKATALLAKQERRSLDNAVDAALLDRKRHGYLRK